MTEIDRQRALSFGTAAEQYESSRPSYPHELIDDLAALAPRSVLEVGAGTGKVSELLLARGLHLLAVEPDERMAAVARRKGVDVEVSTFEEWHARGRSFDLIAAGQSWHWVDRSIGARRALELLSAGGHLAAFWNLGMQDQQALAVLEPIYRELAPSIVDTSASLRVQVDEHRGYLDALRSAGFDPVELRTYPWDATYTTAQWLAMIRTHSDHATLPDDQRNRLLQAVAAAIDELGGSILFHYVTALILATKP